MTLVAAAGALVVGGTLAGGPAQAAPLQSAAPAVGAAPVSAVVMAKPCKLGTRKVVWSAKKKPWSLLAAETVTLPAHASYKRERTLSRDHTYSSSVSSNTKVSAGFKVSILAKLEAETSLDLQKLGSKTTSLTMTETFDIPGASKQRDFVFFKGVRRGYANYQYVECQQVTRAPDSRTWTVLAKGKAQSWTGEWYGAIDCSVKQKSGSIKALARKVGC